MREKENEEGRRMKKKKAIEEGRRKMRVEGELVEIGRTERRRRR